ncbi:unnamed protein product [Pleuronectes platessa]|uniref:Uncharacterized protein n=1 Tax=Pleuronectes platessa TaxID=8262 RepID=A0A9N7UD33_PLEPL|nr:unnamed protein product [Pleuronectes platessa]
MDVVFIVLHRFPSAASALRATAFARPSGSKGVNEPIVFKENIMSLPAVAIGTISRHKHVLTDSRVIAQLNSHGTYLYRSLFHNISDEESDDWMFGHFPEAVY